MGLRGGEGEGRGLRGHSLVIRDLGETFPRGSARMKFASSVGAVMSEFVMRRENCL